ncbi:MULTISPECIES: sensor histidine kinase [Melioribacter]|nr:ATP-binding protein [Melioribacter roseus]
MMNYINDNQIKFKVPLFWKFSIAIILIVIVFGSVNSILIFNNVQTSLQKETEKRGLFIARSISNQITPDLLFEDYVSIQNTINNIKNTDSTIAYILVLDTEKKPIVHTFENRLSGNLAAANSLDGNKIYNTQLLKLKNDESSLILDIAVPVLSGEVGEVRVGLYENFIQNDVEATVMVFWIMVAIFLAFGIIGAFVFANFITKPIKLIQNVADRIDLANIGINPIPIIKIRDRFLGKIKMYFRAEDEIDILADRFNQMIVRLDKAYRDLQKANANLIQSEKLATVGTLTAGIAHEINNPIAGLKNCIRRLINDPENIVQNKKYLAMMDNAVEKIEKVVGNLLNFSRKQNEDFGYLSIHKVIENSLLFVGHRLEKLRITVTKNIPQNLKKIKGNENQLEQVFLNLFINSIDSIEEKLKYEPESERRLSISVYEENNNVVIMIEDTGRGIPKKILNNIFDPFLTTKEPGRGTGLGLSIVYNIIKAHNGKISFESVEGNGTTVKVQLPKNF